MTESAMPHDVLVDPNLHNARMSRVDNFVTAAMYSGFATFASFVIGAGLIKLGHSSFIPLLVAIAVTGLIGVAFFGRKAHKVNRRLADEVTATSDGIHAVVLEKYNLDLIDPVTFDSRIQSDRISDFPNGFLRISNNPHKAIDPVRNCYVEVVLKLSEDNRDVTASVLTPVVAR